MRYIVITTPRSGMPPDMAMPLLDAMTKFVQRHTASGKIEQSFGFAGLPGGGAIVDVDSADELDEIMAEFPLAPFSHVKIYALTDVLQSLERAKKAIGAMMAGMAPS